jgi:imidazoleglycerol-phosphate dehydratase
VSKARGIERTEQGRRIPEGEAARHGDTAVTEAHSPAPRRGEMERSTRETRIRAALHLDGGAVSIAVPNGFFGHMLDALARHGGLGLTLEAEGDTRVDVHHTVEDVGIVLGECLRAAIGDGRGIARYGSAHAPLDEALARAVADVSGRGFLDLTMTDTMERSWVTPDFAMILLRDFFHAFADRGRITLHVDVLKGKSPHHTAEACFKAVALALRQALAVRGGSGADEVPSTKGTITA